MNRVSQRINRKKHMARESIHVEENRPFYLEGSDTGVLMIHGFTATPANMRDIAYRLNRERGYTVNSILLSGHGTAAEALSNVSYRQWINDALAGYEQLQKKGCTRIIVAGHSMGAILSLILSSILSPYCCVSIAAPIKIYNQPIISGSRYLKKFYPYHTYRSPRAGEHGYQVFPTASLAQLMRLIRLCVDSLEQVSCPVQIIQPDKDHTVKIRSATIIHSLLRNVDNKQLVWMPGCGHVCILGENGDKIYDYMTGFIDDFAKKEGLI